jgi:hypothetical protein
MFFLSLTFAGESRQVLVGEGSKRFLNIRRFMWTQPFRPTKISGNFLGPANRE